MHSLRYSEKNCPHRKDVSDQKILREALTRALRAKFE